MPMNLVEALISFLGKLEKLADVFLVELEAEAEDQRSKREMALRRTENA